MQVLLGYDAVQDDASRSNQHCRKSGISIAGGSRSSVRMSQAHRIETARILLKGRKPVTEHVLAGNITPRRISASRIPRLRFVR